MTPSRSGLTEGVSLMLTICPLTVYSHLADPRKTKGRLCWLVKTPSDPRFLSRELLTRGQLTHELDKGI